MNIGIDIDSTITDFHRSIIIHGKKYKNKIKNRNGYSLEEIFDWNKEDINYFNEYIRTTLRIKIKPRKQVKEVLDYLHNKGYKIYIITSRKEIDLINHIENTKKWLKDNNLYYDELIIGNSNKLEECLKHNISIFIDDKIKHCEACHNAGIKTYIFNNVYNKKCKLPRINNFKELIKNNLL